MSNLACICTARVTVILLAGTDKVYVHTTLPNAIYTEADETLALSFEATKNTGVDYVRKNFGIEPIVIDAR